MALASLYWGQDTAYKASWARESCGNCSLTPQRACRVLPSKKMDKVELKPHLLNRLGLYCLCSPLYLGLGFPTNWPHIGHSWVFVPFWLTAWPLVGLKSWLFGRQQIEITSDALWVNAVRVPWSEAKLFA